MYTNMSEITINNNYENDSKNKLTKDSEKNSDVEKYLQQLSDNERKTYEIANQHLESSFSIEKSIGYNKWKKQ